MADCGGSVFNFLTKIKKQARVIKKEKPIFGDNYNPVWELAYEEIHENGSKTIYAPFDNGVSSATPVMDKVNEEKKDKKLKDDVIYPKLNRVAITKEADGSVTFRLVQYISFEKVPKKRKKAINLFEKFDGVLMFYNDQEEFLFGNYFEKGKYAASINVEESLNKSKSDRKAKVNCEICTHSQIDYYYYAYGGGQVSSSTYSYTVYYSICLPCSGGGASYPVISGITQGMGGSSPISGNNGNGPYNPNNTFAFSGTECEAYSRTRNLAAAYGREFNGVKAYDSDNNQYFWIIFPSKDNTYDKSFFYNIYGDVNDPSTLVSWGEGFAPYSYVLVDYSAGTIESRFNLQGWYSTPYTIVGTFHTHPNAIYNVQHVVSPADQTFASNYNSLTHFVFEQNGIRTYNGNGYSDSGHRPCQN